MKKREKVLFLHHSGMMSGGAERSLFELATALKASGVDVSVMLPSRGGLGERFQMAGITVKYAPMRALSRSKNPFKQAAFVISLFRASRKLHQVLCGSRIDIVHANSTSAAFYAAWAWRRSGRDHRILETECRMGKGKPTKLVWHCRDMVELGWLGRWLGSRVAQAVGISDRVGKHLEKYVPNDRIQIIKNGVDPVILKRGRNRHDMRKELRLPQDAQVVGMAAHLIPWKNHRLFLRTCARVAETFHDTHFIIAGGEPNGRVIGYQDQLLALAEELGIARHTHFVGSLPEMGEVYRSIDVLCHPAKNEPFGRVVAEAMMEGVPVVVGGDSGPAEFVEDEKTGLVVDDYCAESFCCAIKRLLDSPSERRRLGDAGAFYAKKNLSITRAASQIRRLYEDLLVDIAEGRARAG